MKRKYFKSKAEANKFRDLYNEQENTTLYNVYRMPRGSRHPGMYAVCSFLEYVNTY